MGVIYVAKGFVLWFVPLSLLLTFLLLKSPLRRWPPRRRRWLGFALLLPTAAWSWNRGRAALDGVIQYHVQTLTLDPSDALAQGYLIGDFLPCRLLLFGGAVPPSVRAVLMETAADPAACGAALDVFDRARARRGDPLPREACQPPAAIEAPR